MRTSGLMTLLRVLVLVGLAASAALYVDYSQAESAFCAGAGCSAVKHSGWGYFGHRYLSVPLVGLFGFGLLLGVSLLGRSELRERALVGLALAGGVGALGFIGIQLLVIGELCWLCMVADVPALFIVACALARAKAGGEGAQASGGALRGGAWVALGLLSVVAPFVWSVVRPSPPVPAQLLALYRPGKINVIEFFDFECEHCRELHPRLGAIVGEYGERVHFLRLHKPLRSHPLAWDAARSAICAERQNRAERMSEALFAARDLSVEANRELAGKLGLDLQEYDRCMADPKTEARLERESGLVGGEGFLGLPTTYVQAQRIVGAQDDVVFRDALERASRGEGNRGVPGWVFLAVVAVVVAGVVRWGRTPASRVRPVEANGDG